MSKYVKVKKLTNGEQKHYILSPWQIHFHNSLEDPVWTENSETSQSSLLEWGRSERAGPHMKQPLPFASHGPFSPTVPGTLHSMDTLARMSKLCLRFHPSKTVISWLFHRSIQRCISQDLGEKPTQWFRAIWAGNAGSWVPDVRSEGVQSP